MRTEVDVAKTISDKFAPVMSKSGIELLSFILERRELEKGEVLLPKDKIARHITHVDKGFLRQFYYKNGKDVTEHFTYEGSSLMCIISMFKKEPTELMVEALEPSIVYNMSYEKLLELSSQSKDICLLTRSILETSLIWSQQKADSWRFETVRERYERFVREFPEEWKRASVHHLASYLLMNPESLSRIRAGLL